MAPTVAFGVVGTISNRGLPATAEARSLAAARTSRERRNADTAAIQTDPAEGAFA